MSNHQLLVVVFVVLVSAAGTAAVTSDVSAQASSPPITVEQTFVGTTEGSEHAFKMTVTIAPSRETGAINNTVLRVRASEAAFIPPSSVSTDERTGGNQVISQRKANALTFDIEKLRPTQMIKVSFRIYPKATVPSGEQLATVDMETQLVTNKRVVSEQSVIAPTVDPDQVSYVVSPQLSPMMSGGIGTVGGMAITLTVLFVYFRRRRGTIRKVLRTARNQATSRNAKQNINKALRLLGGGSLTHDPEQDSNATNDSDDAPALEFND